MSTYGVGGPAFNPATIFKWIQTGDLDLKPNGPGVDDDLPDPEAPDAPTTDAPLLGGNPGGTVTEETVTRLGGLMGAGAFDLGAIARIIIEQNQEAREAARLDRETARDVQMTKLQEAADKIRSQASLALAASIVGGALAVVGSIVQLRGAMKAQAELGKGTGGGLDGNSASKQLTQLSDKSVDTQKSGSTLGSSTSKQLSKLTSDMEIEMQPLKSPTTTTVQSTSQTLTDVPETTPPQGTSGSSGSTGSGGTQTKVPVDGPDAPDVSRPRVIAEMINARHTAAGQMITQSGSIAGAGFNTAGSTQEALKAEAQADATKAQTQAEDQSDFIRAYADLIQTVLSKLAEAQSQEAETNRRIVSG